MNIYAVYMDSSKKDTDLKLIEQKFSIFAALLNLPWAIYHKMWKVLILLIVSAVIALPLEDYKIYYIYEVLVFLTFGFFASDLQEYYAKKSGYELIDIIAANSAEEAELKFYQNYPNP